MFQFVAVQRALLFERLVVGKGLQFQLVAQLLDGTLQMCGLVLSRDDCLLKTLVRLIMRVLQFAAKRSNRGLELGYLVAGAAIGLTAKKLR